MPRYDVQSLESLPRRPREVWQGGLVRMPTWVTEPGKKPFMPWGGAWVSLGPGLIHVGRMGPPSERTPGQALEAFVQFALDPKSAGYLPGRVEVTGPGVATDLQRALAPLGIAVVEREPLAALDDALACMDEGLNDGVVMPGAFSPPGATLDRFASFAEAARLFYEAAPWRHLTDEDLIRIEEPRGPAEQRHALVLGAGGHEFGLLLFESPALHEKLLSADTGREVFKRETHCSIFFGEITALPFEDAGLFEDHRLPVAGPAAYPWAARFGPKLRVQRLSPRAMAHVEAVLRALAASSEQEIDSGRWTRIVPAPDGPAAVRLALPGLLEERVGRAGGARPPDRRTTERALAEIGRTLEGERPASAKEANAIINRRFMGRPLDEIPSSAATPLEKAQDLCYQAFECLGRRRVALARQALAICPDCADAYAILAERTGDPEEVIRFYREAAAAGERALGSGRFKSDAPFWADVSTRPYMRAVQGLADTCARRGRIDEAIDLYQRLLRLNPNDNQGVREPLAGLLLGTGDDAALEALLDKHAGECEVTLLYARALLLFRKGGKRAGSLKALRRALAENRHVPAILLDRGTLPPLPDRYALGSKEEALGTAHEIAGAWRDTPGALDWLKKQAG